MERLRNKYLAVGLCLSLGIAACGGEETTPESAQDNDDIAHSVEVVDGRLYDCHTYTKVDRGGIDCERIRVGESDSTKITPSHNGSIAISTEVIGERAYDCFAYTAIDRGGLDCVPVS